MLGVGRHAGHLHKLNGYSFFLVVSLPTLNFFLGKIDCSTTTYSIAPWVDVTSLTIGPCLRAIKSSGWTKVRYQSNQIISTLDGYLGFSVFINNRMANDNRWWSNILSSYRKWLFKVDVHLCKMLARLAMFIVKWIIIINAPGRLSESLILSLIFFVRKLCGTWKFCYSYAGVRDT